MAQKRAVGASYSQKLKLSILASDHIIELEARNLVSLVANYAFLSKD